MKIEFNNFINIFIATAIGSFFIYLPLLSIKYFYFFLGVIFFFLLSYLTKLLIARHYDYIPKLSFINIRRVWFDYKLPFPLPLWILIPFIFSALSYGAIKLFIFLKTDYYAKIGRIKQKFIYREFDLAKISLLSLIICFFFILIFHSLNLKFLASIGILFLISNSLPFGSLDGAKIFNGSWILWCSVEVFFLISLFLINLTGILISIFLGLIFFILIGIYLLFKNLT